MRRLPVITSLAVACGVSHPATVQRRSPTIVFREEFATPATIQRSWVAAPSSIAGAFARIEDETLQLTSPDGKGEVVVRRRLDLEAIRGKRVRIHVRARTSATSSTARATISVAPSSGVASYADSASTRRVSSKNWSSIDTVIDIDPDAVTGEVSLVARGSGSAWFDDVDVSIVGDAPRPMVVQLSSRQLENVEALTRAASYIRYLHPSDQAASCDWDAFLPNAISQVLDAKDRSTLRAKLRQLFAAVAPTVTFVEQGDTTAIVLPVKGSATQLTRWRRFGLGPSGTYVGFREGRDNDDVEVERSVRVKLPNPKVCPTAQLEAKLRRGNGKAWLFLRAMRPLMAIANSEGAVTDAHELSVKAEIPGDSQELVAGVRLEGRGSVTLEELTLVCDKGPRIPIEIRSDWEGDVYSSLSRWTVRKCGTRTCATLERNGLDRELVADRDVADIDIGGGLHMRMPLAVWSDAEHTLPIGDFESPPRQTTIHDLSTRLAAASMTWSTLALFYPYFKDQQIKWDSALPPALQAAASARSPQELHEALSRLVARMRDDHARVSHPGYPVTGIVPLALRRFGNQVAVVGGLPEYVETLPPGTEVLSIDDVPALRAYDRMAERVSASTQGWKDYATPYYLTLGPVGTFRHFRFRLVNGKERAVTLPLVSRDLYDSAVREPRPKTGTEVAPGVIYVDFEGIREDAWRGLLPTLQRARAMIFDLRGYTTNAGMSTLAHLTDRELPSPPWQIPVIDGGRTPTYGLSSWSLFPAAPRLTAPVVVLLDGRSASAVETMLQTIRDAKLAALVGETSGGTNGNTNGFTVPGEFSVRFTGMRVDGPDGITIQGRGIVPDKVVHPTLDGIRAGRDEILEAGVAEAQRLVHN